MKKIKSFTLAEVLITLVVIGIIAVITVPVIQAYYTEQATIAKVKKIYSTLSQGINKIKIDGLDMEDWGASKNSYSNALNLESYIKSNFNILKYCGNAGSQQASECWSKEAKLMNGNSYWRDNGDGKGWGDYAYTFILNDGTYVNFGANELTEQVGVNSNIGTIIFFDINGDSKPNIVGKDIFATVITQNGIVPAYNDKTSEEKESDCSLTGTGFSCIFNYLKK